MRSRLSTVAGLSFVAASAQDEARLSMLAGYAAVGAVLYLVWTVRDAAKGRSRWWGAAGNLR